MANDMSMMFDSILVKVKDEPQSTDVIDKMKSNDDEKLKENLMSDKYIEILESSISINDTKNGEEISTNDVLKQNVEITEASVREKDTMQGIESLQYSNNSDLVIIDDIMTTSEVPIESPLLIE